MGCKCKQKLDGCQNCVNGTVAGGTTWVDCSYWSSREDMPVVNGQYVRYTNGSVRTKEGSKCEQYSRQGV